MGGMRHGFTTGSCAAAAAKAAAYMLLTGKEKTQITIKTPKGIPYTAQLCHIVRGETQVSCAVRKDGGDDPDVTSGTLIGARVSLKKGGGDTDRALHIEGGAGVGRVTLPGLDQPVGAAAINRVPREMIEREVSQVCALADYNGGLDIEIFAPDGEALAAKTFNPRLGIVGGISILGTSGIVEPMSSRALLETIRAELSQRRALGYDYVAVSPGNYGLAFMKRAYGYDLDRSVKCGNFIGETVDMAVELGFCRMLLTGHIGKLVKLSGGIMNTHSREGDCRMELLAAAGLRRGMEPEALRRILACAASEEAVRILEESGKRREVMEDIMRRIGFYLDRRAGDTMKIDCIMYANAFGELGRIGEVETWFTLLERDAARWI